jgi:hypothetical protein
LVPLSKAMKDGKEPLRTFGDLMQFYQFKSGDEQPAPAAKKESERPVQGANQNVDPASEAAKVTEINVEAGRVENEKTEIDRVHGEQHQGELGNAAAAEHQAPENVSAAALSDSTVDTTI